MTLTDLIKDQIFESAVIFAAGIGLGALRSLFVFCKGTLTELCGDPLCGKCDSTSRRRQGQEAFLSLLEILFWIFAAVYTTGFLGYAAYGALSVHVFLMMFLGVLLWRRIFYGKIKY